MMNYLEKIITEATTSPWKAWYELKRLIYHPFILTYLKLKGVKVGRGTKWYGFPIVFRSLGSQIIIGDKVEIRNWTGSNPLGVNHPLILTTWKSGAIIRIGRSVGITGGTICAAQEITVGSETLVGANCTIIDTDFHPLASKKRRYSQNKIGTRPITIGKNVFLGMNSQILKGVIIGDNSILGAGSVLSGKQPANTIFGGNPAKKIKNL